MNFELGQLLKEEMNISEEKSSNTSRRIDEGVNKEKPSKRKSLTENFKILKGEKNWAYADLAQAEIDFGDVEAYACGDAGDVFYVVFKDGSKEVYYYHAGIWRSATECGFDNEETVREFEEDELGAADDLEESTDSINEAELGDRGRYDGPRIIQFSVDVYDSSFSKSGLSEDAIADALEEAGIQVLGCAYQCSWKNDHDYERNIQESLDKE